jgi:hypothetical protein
LSLFEGPVRVVGLTTDGDELDEPLDAGLDVNDAAGWLRCFQGGDRGISGVASAGVPRIIGRHGDLCDRVTSRRANCPPNLMASLVST